MAAHHEPFKALGPLNWQTLLGNDESDRTRALADLLKSTFASAQVLVDSIPGGEDGGNNSSSSKSKKAHTSTSTTTSGRARSQTDSAVAAPSVQQQQQLNPLSALLRKEWKEIKTSPKDNPLGIAVHKLSARDGNGAWFARRSMHRGLPFEKWVLGLRREFAETSAVRSGATDSKSVRGLGAERRVYLVSVRFPGPTTPRDFVTVVLMPEDGVGEGGRGGEKGRRRFMLVSRPCVHGGCGPRQGFIRGTYESVEMVREVPVGGRGLRKTRSSEDLRVGDGVPVVVDGEELGKEVLKAAAARRAVVEGVPSRTASSSPGPPGDEDEDTEMAIEWLMVTRSDPGGSVPRFMVEKGTPGGIINDAGRFLNWLTHKKEEDLRAAMEAGADELDVPEETSLEGTKAGVDGDEANIKTAVRSPTDDSEKTITEDVALPTGFYGMIASALEAAGSVVISRMSSLAGSAAGSTRTDSEVDDDLDSESDTSELSYASAEEGNSLTQPALSDIKNSPSIPDIASSARSIQSTLSSSSHVTPGPADQQHDKELRRLQDRQRRAHEKMLKMQEKLAAKRKETDSEKDKEVQEAALAKLREKHAREMAKHEEKFQRDLIRLQEKRDSERRKAEDRRRKAEEREERRNVQAELEKTRAERDVALREIEILKEQVGALQSQNTTLVARLGREGSVVSLGKH
ncbi:hypothetical protein B0T16DRAFT_328852 [Cercophora newfieldiana]|uniref:DUF3074 domain-containing protein n=1 Tax=Cercophora newfieldiana TaxID=92897 RepID=A0AA39Y5E3_9PEZI|nr:hypothetical protein B0T16DRAFT_328852 [Cercophora newfieldiana]